MSLDSSISETEQVVIIILLAGVAYAGYRFYKSNVTQEVVGAAGEAVGTAADASISFTQEVEGAWSGLYQGLRSLVGLQDPEAAAAANYASANGVDTVTPDTASDSLDPGGG